MVSFVIIGFLVCLELISAPNCDYCSFANIYRFIEGDFNAYVKRIQQPHVWGGEPELLMASHVLK